MTGVDRLLALVHGGCTVEVLVGNLPFVECLTYQSLRVCSIKAMTEKRMCPISTTKYMNLLDIGMQKVGGGRMEFALDSYRKTGLQKSGQERPTAELSIEILN